MTSCVTLSSEAEETVQVPARTSAGARGVDVGYP